MSDKLVAPRARAVKNLLVGLTLISVGFIFLNDRYDLIPELDWRTLVPALLVFFGAIDLVFSERAEHAASAVFRIALGIWLYMVFNHISGWTFENSWPFMLIAVGLRVLLQGWSSKSE